MIEVSDLVKEYGGQGGPQRVLDGISLTIRRGEVTMFIGSTGAGKSTLLRCINGLEVFHGGAVRVGELALQAGTNTSSVLQALRRRVGMVFQQFHLFPHLTALENVLCGPLYAQGRRRTEAEPEARALLAQVGLADFADRRPEQLSGGQQQRVAIARALAVQPEAILFDEPTASLDPSMAGEVLGVIDRLADAGQTMVVVTHDIDFTRHVADTVHFLHQGKVIESGTPEELFDRPRTPELARMLGKKSPV